MAALGTEEMTPAAQNPGPVRDDDESVRKIPLRNMKREVVAHAYVDAADFDKVNALKWHRAVFENNTYANGSMFMHTFIMGSPPENMVIDHWNGDGLDNRRCNLRFACRSLNSHNKKKRAGTSSRFKGVSKNGLLWSAELKGRKLGLFKDEVHAAYMYDLAAIEEYGEHANINGVKKPADWKLPVKRPRAPKKTVSVKVDKDMSDVTRTADGHAYVMAKNERILVSDSDWPVVAKYTWTFGRYASTRIDGKPMRMHKLLMGDKRGYKVDHINNNRYDNRRCNLRWATSSENKQNVRPREGYKYRGYQFQCNGYAAKITVKRKYHYIGRYRTEELAAIAYNYAARHFYGEHAYQNDLPDDPGYVWDLDKFRLVPRTAA
jgi:HNH endonuclease